MGKRNKNKRGAAKKKKGKGARQWQFDQAPDVLFTVNSDRQILLMNREMAGFQPDQMLGKDSMTLFPPRIKGWYRKNIKRAFSDRDVVNFQFSTEDSVWWEVRIVPVRHDERVTEAIVICSDVTERRIRQAQAIRHARLATIGVLSAGVAHEINNPNGANLFNASLLSRAWTDLTPILEGYQREKGDFSLAGLPCSEARETLPALLKEISANTDRIKQIVEGLKHLAGQDEERLDERVDLNHTLRAAMMILNHKVRKHTDHCDLSFGKSLPKIVGNSRQLEQVFINVILNALQSLSGRNKRVMITTQQDRASQRIQLIVEDEGCGVSAEHIGRLTEPFFTTRIKAGGTGLGLSISNLILLKHAATIRFKPREEEGTCVTITFPTHRERG
ncbi:MAG: PAS domain-containing protein [Magnetococcales bacterium]|nr:PAS domain-containing protein [Magnetococcales bacterium]